MLVFHAPSKVDFVFLRGLASLGLSIHILDKNNVIQRETFSKGGNINNIQFLFEDKIGITKIIDYLPEKNVIGYLSLLRLERMFSRSSKFFTDIDMLDQKLNLTLVSSLEYYSAGLIYAYYLEKRTSKSQKLFIINCELKSFITHEFKLFDRDCIHILLPIGQLLSTIYRFIKSLIFTVSADKGCSEIKIKKCSILEKPDNDVAILFHRSDSYGQLYGKKHYFSRNKSHRLHWDNVVKCAIFADENTPKYLTPLKAPVNKWDILKFLNFMDPIVFLWSSIQEKRAQIILYYRYLEYRAWLRVFKNSTLKHVIIDYDLLFPKSLSLALEHVGIKTFAFQERASLSMYHMTYGVICDTYVYSGALWRSYGEKNKSIICKSSYNFSHWRNIFFFANTIKIQDMRFHIDAKRGRTRKKIVFLGYFLDSQSPATNLASNHQFLDYVTIVAKKFSDCSVFIRMKELDKTLYQHMLTKFSDTENVFISTQYDNDGLSYSLCSNADVIVSVQTSLAEQALAVGKHVILIDNLYTVNEMCTNTYPPDFNFLIAHSSVDIVSLIERIFSLDQKLLASYGSLKDSLAADYNFKSQADIPRAIENILSIVPEKFTSDC